MMVKQTPQSYLRRRSSRPTSLTTTLDYQTMTRVPHSNSPVPSNKRKLTALLQSYKKENVSWMPSAHGIYAPNSKRYNSNDNHTAII